VPSEKGGLLEKRIGAEYLDLVNYKSEFRPGKTESVEIRHTDRMVELDPIYGG
jgi:hypothetical protein